MESKPVVIQTLIDGINDENLVIEVLSETFEKLELKRSQRGILLKFVLVRGFT